MDTVREVSSVANALRKREGKRVRLPLPRLTIVVPDAAALAQFEDILRDELNIKKVELVELEAGAPEAYGISHRLTVNARAAGPRLGKQVQRVIQAARAGDWSESDGSVTAGGVQLQPGEYELVVETAGRPDGEALAVLASGGFVVLDTTTNAALEAEGLARDVIRAVQDTRKAAGFDVSDRIRLLLSFRDENDADAVATAFDVADIADETLAREAAIVGADGTTSLSRGTLRGTPAETPEHQAEFAAGTFANAGAFTVAVTRLTEGNDA
jgi:isoleucyl-tRNA synthetase